MLKCRYIYWCKKYSKIGCASCGEELILFDTSFVLMMKDKGAKMNVHLCLDQVSYKEQ